MLHFRLLKRFFQQTYLNRSTLECQHWAFCYRHIEKTGDCHAPPGLAMTHKMAFWYVIARSVATWRSLLATFLTLSTGDFPRFLAGYVYWLSSKHMLKGFLYMFYRNDLQAVHLQGHIAQVVCGNQNLMYAGLPGTLQFFAESAYRLDPPAD